MELSTPEFAYVRAKGLFIVEKCDACEELLNQSFRYVIPGKPEVYCSSGCCDLAFFKDPREAKKHSTPGKCAYCGGSLKGKKRGSIFCDDTCRKALPRKTRRITTLEVEKSRTPTQSNQRVASQKKCWVRDRIARGTQPLRNAPSEVSAEGGLPVEVGPAVLGSRSS